MNRKIEIKVRLFKNIEDFCKRNGINVSKYIEEALSDRINTDMYGDLNDFKVKKEEIILTKTEFDIKNKILNLWVNNEIEPKFEVHLESIKNFNKCVNTWYLENNKTIVNNEDIVFNEKKDETIKRRKLKIK